MIKTLTPHGNSAALIIDKEILEVLKIDMSTPLEIITDGESLIIFPVRDDSQHDRVSQALEKINARHGQTLRELAE